MFSLLAGLVRYLWSKHEFHLLLLGLDGAGKTSTLEKIKQLFSSSTPLPPEKIAPTVGLNIGRLAIGGAKLTIWDLGGQASLRAIWESYYAEAQGLIYVVDAADSTRLDEARVVLGNLLTEPDLANIPLLILANKQDSLGALPPEEVKQRLALLAADSRPMRVMGTSALDGEGIEDGVLWLFDQLKAVSR